MKTSELFRLISALFLMLALIAAPSPLRATGVSALSSAREPARALAGSYPLDTSEQSGALGAAGRLKAVGPLVVDHTAVDQYDDIPQEYIDIIKTKWLNVPGESHSAGYRNGLLYLEDIDSRFQVNVTEETPPEPYTDQHLRVSRITWGAYGWSQWGYGEEDWYTNAAAITKTKNHLDYCNTHDLQIAAIGFGWCWDMTWHNSPTGTADSVYQVRWAGSSVDGPDGDKAWGLDACDIPLVGNRVTMDTYLSATQQYVEHALAQGYTTTVFFTTGPVDGSAGESGYQRHLKHEHIRNYVRNSGNLVLFDYADILSWNDAGQQNLQSWTDHGGVSKQYQMIHPDNMQDFDPPYGDLSGGDHIGEYGAVRLAKALWWMLARLAGWDGVVGSRMELAKTALTKVTTQGETLTYTVTVQGTNMPPTATVALTDTVPTGLLYVPGSLTATGGSWDDGAAPALRWTGVLTPTPTVTVTYAVTVTATTPQFITNTAIATAPGHETISTTASISVTQPPGYPDLTPSYKAVSSPSADHGERITYTVGIRNATGPLSATVLFTDTLQDGLAYVPGSLTATAGAWDDGHLPTLTWTGVLTPSPAITITYAAVVTYVIPGSTAILPATITNTAVIATPGYQAVTRTATVQVNLHQMQIYLPSVLRQG